MRSLGEGRLGWAGALIAFLGLLAGCATAVEGTPRAAAVSKTGLAAIEPCELIPESWLEPLELSEGKYSEANEQQLRPHGCRWRANDDMISYGDVNASVSPDMSVAEYMQGIEFSGEEQLGGLTWQVIEGAGGIGGDCGLITAVSETSFVEVASANYKHEEKACDKAKEVAPVVAAGLPGGDPVGEPPPVETDPLADTDPCALLKHEQAEKLGYQGDGKPSESDDRVCSWSAAEPDSKLADIVVVIDSKRPLGRQFDVDPDEELRAGGRTWLVFDAPSGTLGSCYVGTDTSKRSHLRIFSSDSKNKRKACEPGKKLAPVVTKNLPAGS